MQKVLRKRIFRDFKENLPRYLALAFLLILSMYMGRIGPLSLTLAIAHRQQNEDRILLPEEKIAVG